MLDLNIFNVFIVTYDFIFWRIWVSFFTPIKILKIMFKYTELREKTPQKSGKLVIRNYYTIGVCKANRPVSYTGVSQRGWYGGGGGGGGEGESPTSFPSAPCILTAAPFVRHLGTRQQIDNFSDDVHASFFKLNNNGSIELLYSYKQAKTSRITVLNIRKLYLYFVYFKLYVYFERSPPGPLKNDACAHHLESCLFPVVMYKIWSNV